jgi:formylglycine-generating enzyme required for sulfatase activity
VRAKVAEWKSEEVRASAQEVPLGGSVAHKGRTKALSATARVEELRRKVDHGSTVAAAEGWLAKASSAQAAAAAARAPAASSARPTASSGGAGSDWRSPTLGTMKWIPAGSFTMGSPSSESGRYDDEGPQHRVTLTKGFWLMEHEVTQGEWAAVMGSNPAYNTSCGSTCPVERVSWTDALEFAKRASARDGVTYRLPTESEWEYAARGGQSYVYAGSAEAGSVAWTSDNSGGRTHAVCGKSRNGFGLCDMSGNVFEWTSDWYTASLGPATDPVGASSGAYRVYRGGSWRDGPRVARVACRYYGGPDSRVDFLGLRLARTVP